MNIEPLHTAGQQLPFLFARALAGEDIVISDAEAHQIRLVPCNLQTQKRVSGGWRGKAQIADDFDVLPPEMMRALGAEIPK